MRQNDIHIVKSPLNYIGGKYKLLPQLLPLFPKEINTFVDLFSGGANVGVNVRAKKVVCNDNLVFLIDLYKEMQALTIEEILNHIYSQINKYELSLTNEKGYIAIREEYNYNRKPLDLFVLVAYSFNHQIRFNNSHQFNNPFGRQRSQFNQSMKQNLVDFVSFLHSKDITFTCKDFDRWDFSLLGKDDFVYLDPPYLITTGTYNDGKRGFTGWSEQEEIKLLRLLDYLSSRGIRFALSNVLEHKGKTNFLLEQWARSNQYNIVYLDKDYSNSNYHTLNRDKKSSTEVLITNYTSVQDMSKKSSLQFSIFDSAAYISV